MEKLRQLGNNVWIGLAIGLIIPLFLGILIWVLQQNVEQLKNADLLYIGAVAVNAYTMQYFNKLYKENIGKGILSATFLWAFIFFFYKVL